MDVCPSQSSFSPFRYENVHLRINTRHFVWCVSTVIKTKRNKTTQRTRGRLIGNFLLFFSVYCGGVARSGCTEVLASGFVRPRSRMSLVGYLRSRWELMNGPRRRATLIALRRGLDALVSSTFFSISLCIMLGVSSHALFTRERYSLICFASKRLLSLVGDETFRVCLALFKLSCLRI